MPAMERGRAGLLRDHLQTQDQPQTPLLARQRTQAPTLPLTVGETMEATAGILGAMVVGRMGARIRTVFGYN